MPMNPSDALPLLLRNWIRGHDLHVRAAVELLIEHDYWLRRPDFAEACVTVRGGEATISWRNAADFLASGTKASDTEEAILRQAIALGEDWFLYDKMGELNTRLMLEAVRTALGA